MSLCSYFSTSPVKSSIKNISIEDLFQKDFEINGNINISVMGLITNQDVICFGGGPRDMIAIKQSTDIDLIYKTKHTHEFDGDTFIDIFQNEIKDIYKVYGLDATIDKTEIVSLGCKTGYFDSKYTENQDCEYDNKDNYDKENNCDITDKELLDMIMFPKITPGHCSYTLTITDGNEKKYITILDITFPKGDAEVLPAVEEDSLQTFMPSGKFIELLSTCSSALEALEKIKNCLIENCSSMILYKDTEKIISNLRDRKITVYNVDQVKRIIKLAKLVYRGYKIITVDANLRSKIMGLKHALRLNKEELNSEQEKYFNYLYINI